MAGDILKNNIIFVLDDRELVSNSIMSFVGHRRYGDIVLKGLSISNLISSSLPLWISNSFYHLKSNDDLNHLKRKILESPESIKIFSMSSNSGFLNYSDLNALLERLPYSEVSFCNKKVNPCIAYFFDVLPLLENWDKLLDRSVPHSISELNDTQVLTSVDILDLSDVNDFLEIFNCTTAARHFNQIKIEKYIFTKKSNDIKKIKSEYEYYNLVPQSMRGWLVEPFNYREWDDAASYSMIRYYISDVSLQWIHGAFNEKSFGSFLDRLFYFVEIRTKKQVETDCSNSKLIELFIEKLECRYIKFIENSVCQHINAIALSSDTKMSLEYLIGRYKKIFFSHKTKFSLNYLVIGHGDPCFSNILYDQRLHLLKLIDPKGAISESELWTHPYYDVCKISQCILGGYDYINNGQFSITMSESGKFQLNIEYATNQNLKHIFLNKVVESGYDINLVRIGEVSLFLSMLPLHCDSPKKLLAFMLTAKQIMDEIEEKVER